MEKLLLLMLAIASQAAAMADWGYPEVRDVVILERHNHDQFVRDFEVKVVQYSTSDCIHCHEFDLSYSKLALFFKEHDPRVPLAKIDCSVHEEFCSDHLIPVYPFVKIYVKNHAIPYFGPRSEARLRQFIISILRRSPTTVDSKDILLYSKSKSIQGQKRLKLLYFGQNTEKSYSIFDLVCKTDIRLSCYQTNNESLASQIGLIPPFKLIALTRAGKPTVYRKGKFTFELLEEFVFQQFHRKVHEIGPVFKNKVVEEGSDSLILFVPRLDDPIVKKFEKSVRKLRRLVPCFIASTDSGDQELVAGLVHSLSIATYPAVVLARHIHGLSFQRFTYKYSLDSKHLKEFLDNVWQRRLLPDLKSEQSPATNEGPIRVRQKLTS